MAGRWTGWADRWWQAKSVRDQRVLGAVMALLFAALWYQLAWLPFDRMRQAARAELRELSAASQALARLPGNAAARPLDPDNLQTAIADRIEAEGLVVSAMETEAGRIVISFETVPFEAFARWLFSVSTLADIRIEAAQIERRPEPGTVSADIELSLP